MGEVLDDWTRTLLDDLDAVRLAELDVEPTVYRVFLLPDRRAAKTIFRNTC